MRGGVQHYFYLFTKFEIIQKNAIITELGLGLSEQRQEEGHEIQKLVLASFASASIELSPVNVTYEYICTYVYIASFFHTN